MNVLLKYHAEVSSRINTKAPAPKCDWVAPVIPALKSFVANIEGAVLVIMIVGIIGVLAILAVAFFTNAGKKLIAVAVVWIVGAILLIAGFDPLSTVHVCGA